MGYIVWPLCNSSSKAEVFLKEQFLVINVANEEDGSFLYIVSKGLRLMPGFWVFAVLAHVRGRKHGVLCRTGL